MTKGQTRLYMGGLLAAVGAAVGLGIRANEAQGTDKEGQRAAEFVAGTAAAMGALKLFDMATRDRWMAKAAGCAPKDIRAIRKG